MNRMGEAATRLARTAEQRMTTRQLLGVPGRLVWKDSRGTTRHGNATGGLRAVPFADRSGCTCRLRHLRSHSGRLV